MNAQMTPSLNLNESIKACIIKTFFKFYGRAWRLEFWFFYDLCSAIIFIFTLCLISFFPYEYFNFDSLRCGIFGPLIMFKAQTFMDHVLNINQSL